MTKAISIMGCGLMGAAFAQAYLEAGYEVTVWNRTPEKCLPIVARGAKQADSFALALTSAPLVLVILLDNASLKLLLEQHQDKVKGVDIINLMTSLPKDAVEMQEYVTRLGGCYLDGAIEAYPDDIGAKKTIVNYSGDKAVWDRHEASLLVPAGRSRWIGSYVGAASVLDTAMVGGFFITAVGAFLEAASFASKSGVPVQELSESAEYFIDLMHGEIKSVISSLTTQDFNSDQATLNVYVTALKTWRQAMIDAGEPAHLLSANLHAMEMAIAAGHGNSGIAATYSAPRTVKDL